MLHHRLHAVALLPLSRSLPSPSVHLHIYCIVEVIDSFISRANPLSVLTISQTPVIKSRLWIQKSFFFYQTKPQSLEEMHNVEVTGSVNFKLL